MCGCLNIDNTKPLSGLEDICSRWQFSEAWRGKFFPLELSIKLFWTSKYLWGTAERRSPTRAEKFYILITQNFVFRSINLFSLLVAVLPRCNEKLSYCLQLTLMTSTTVWEAHALITWVTTILKLILQSSAVQKQCKTTMYDMKVALSTYQGLFSSLRCLIGSSHKDCITILTLKCSNIL